MTEEEKKKMKDLEDAVAKGAADLKTLTDEKTKLEATIVEKDTLIEQKNQDIVGARRGAQKLKELTDKDKEAMDQQQIDIHNATLELQQKTEKFEKEQGEVRGREVASRRDAIIAKMVGRNPDLSKKVLENLSKLNPELVGKAVTDEELTPLVESAVNMLGSLKPDPIKAAINGTGGADGGEGGAKSFGDTPEAANLAGMMNLKGFETKKE